MKLSNEDKNYIKTFKRQSKLLNAINKILESWIKGEVSFTSVMQKKRDKMLKLGLSLARVINCSGNPNYPTSAACFEYFDSKRSFRQPTTRPPTQPEIVWSLMPNQEVITTDPDYVKRTNFIRVK